MEIQTERLRLRPLEENDWRGMGEVFADFRNSPYAAYDHPMPAGEEAVRALTKQFAGTGLFFAVFLQDSPGLLGYVCFHPAGDSLDVGYCFRQTAQGRGYAAESVSALLDYLARTRHVARFTAGTALANLPSCKLLRRLGFAQVATETVSFDGNFSFEGGRFVREQKTV